MSEPVDVGARLRAVRERIAEACASCGRDPESVHLLAATKTRSEQVLREAFRAGVRVMGENYVQELCDKAEALGDLSIDWHFVGHLQRRKARRIAPFVGRVHSVDSRRLAVELARRAEQLGRRIPVCIEVNIGGEESKGGFEPDELRAEFAELSDLPGLHIDGLMTLPPFRDDPEDVRPYFRAVRELRDELAERHHHPLPELSMGMSGDLEAAVSEGATWVRVGTALFGPRPPREA